jgi:putative oxidoreductase
MRYYQINKNWLMLIGRILFSSTFLFSAFGIRHIFANELILLYRITVGFPTLIDIILVIAGILEVVGACLILLGWHTRLGGLFLFIFTLVVIFAAHHFWTYPSSETFNQLRFFMGDVALLGGCLYIIAFGGGKYSLDYLRRDRQEDRWFKGGPMV